MVKKREKHKNNWLIIVVAIIAVIALILAAVAMTKANITGDAISDWIPWLKKDKVQEQTQVAGGGTGLSTNCIGDVYSVSDCHGICKTGQTCTKLGSSRNWCCVKDSSTENTQIGEGEIYRGLLAEKYLDAGMSIEDLKGYEVKYGPNGDLIYEVKSNSLRVGEGYEISEDPEDSSVRIVHPIGEDPLEASATGSNLPFFTWRCGCAVQYAPNGHCQSSCNWIQYPNGNIENCQGQCYGDLCVTSECTMGPTGIVF
jgi:hypothetical protein